MRGPNPSGTIFGGKSVCPPDCPKRRVGCHNVETCEKWAAHVEERRKEYERRIELAGKRMRSLDKK